MVDSVRIITSFVPLKPVKERHLYISQELRMLARDWACIIILCNRYERAEYK